MSALKATTVLPALSKGIVPFSYLKHTSTYEIVRKADL